MPLTWTQETGEGEEQRVVGGICLGDTKKQVHVGRVELELDPRPGVNLGRGCGRTLD